MKCLSPISVRCDEGDYNVVPCGRCIVCKDNRIKDWFIRIMCEVSYCDYSKFVTLTYDDEHVGMNELDHRDWQLYMKRVRKSLGDIKVKYYMCGEYGEEMGRRHFHAIMMFYDVPEDFDLRETITGSWSCGFVSVGSVTPRSVRYCLNYMEKEFKNKDHKVVPYQKMSQGLGDRYFNDQKHNLGKLGYLSYEGKKYDIPRYAKEKYENEIKIPLREKPLDEVYARRVAKKLAEDLSREVFVEKTKEENEKAILLKKIYKSKARQSEMNIKKRKNLKKKRI